MTLTEKISSLKVGNTRIKIKGFWYEIEKTRKGKLKLWGKDKFLDTLEVRFFIRDVNNSEIKAVSYLNEKCIFKSFEIDFI